ncbi:unnamed protein product, partial [Polarella glacialis]
VQQLAWHSQQNLGQDAGGEWSEEVLAVGPQAPRSAGGISEKQKGSGGAQKGMPPQTEAEKLLSGLLQHMRVPHVLASPSAMAGGIYRVPVWFPDPKAVLELEVSGDRLTSGGLGGAAELRRRQLRAAGLKVHSF